MPITSKLSGLLMAGFLLVSCGRSNGSPVDPPPSPATAAAGLLAADSAFSAASAGTDAVAGLSAMFAPDITMPLPGGKFAVGAPAAVEFLRSNLDSLPSRAEWTPIRVGLSADGLHGLTFGYGTLVRPDSSRLPWKYLAYWVKGSLGWRVVVYKRAPRADSVVSLARMPAVLPPLLGAPGDSATIEGFRASLDQAERGFSDEAQRIGLGPAFVKWGQADAVNMGGPSRAGFVVGPAAIAAAVSDGGPATGSAVSWAPDRVIVAGSGDLGVTIGMIRPNQAPPAGSAPGFAFFTIWYRASLSEPWRYLAE